MGVLKESRSSFHTAPLLGDHGATLYIAEFRRNLRNQFALTGHIRNAISSAVQQRSCRRSDTLALSERSRVILKLPVEDLIYLSCWMARAVKILPLRLLLPLFADTPPCPLNRWMIPRSEHGSTILSKHGPISFRTQHSAWTNEC